MYTFIVSVWTVHSGLGPACMCSGPADHVLNSKLYYCGIIDTMLYCIQYTSTLGYQHCVCINLTLWKLIHHSWIWKSRLQFQVEMGVNALSENRGFTS
jgi:hypothetical protein